jgi:hypothetical protein
VPVSKVPVKTVTVTTVTVARREIVVSPIRMKAKVTVKKNLAPKLPVRTTTKKTSLSLFGGIG